MSRSWFDKEEAYQRINNHISFGQTEVRIAVGYFSVGGWNLLRAAIGDKQVNIIVGINYSNKKRDIRDIKQIIIEEIIKALKQGLAEDNRQSVEDLIKIIQAGKFKIVDGRAYQHHGKVYIVDRSIAIVASANLSKKGLKQQTEAGINIYETDEINNLIQKFDFYFAQSINLTEELLNALINWLKYASPWDAYLKTLLAFEDLSVDNKYITPAMYQIDLIGKTLRHIREYSGSMLVASTGLGKTVVATHVALQLKRKNEIENVLILCPKLVKRAWNTALRKASISCDTITYNSLDKENPGLDFNLEEFLEIEQDINSKWLMVIDESHYFRNSKETKEGFNRRSFQRLISLVQRSDCKVLLLTGSPYSKNISNLNNQLLLLPHTNDEISLNNNYYWNTNTVEEFIKLPVVSQLTTPFVAKKYGKKEDNNIFIEFGNSKKYIPSVNLYKLNVPFFLENEVSQIIQSNILSVAEPITAKNSINIEVQKCWASSPEALNYALTKVVNTPNGKNSHDVIFELSVAERLKKIQPILKKLKNLDISEDKKLLVLIKIIQKIHDNGNKIIIFCERLATVVYLEKTIKKFIPSIKIFATIKLEKDKYLPKNTIITEKGIKRFAPVANSATIKTEDTYDIFISTDSHGVGINLQDAPVVINYDLSWTPIEPIQRAGRVLRPWNTPRTVKLYSFFPTTTKISLKNISIIKRSQNLTKRHSICQTILDLPVLPLEDEKEISDLSTVASNISIASGKLDLDALANESVSSSLQQHTSTLYQNRNYARQIKSFIITSKEYAEKKVRIYILLAYKENLHRVVYSINHQYNKTTYSEESSSLEQLLGWLKCQPDAKKAYTTLEKIERLADNCIKKWSQKYKVNCNEITRICIVYLKPDNSKDKITNLASD